VRDDADFGAGFGADLTKLKSLTILTMVKNANPICYTYLSFFVDIDFYV
jgi:hypothetical protein